MPDVRFQVLVDDARWKKLLPEYKRIIATALKSVEKNCALHGEISVLLTNDTYIRKLNKTYRRKNKPTNVLSFPQNDPVLLGDIIMALDTLKHEAEAQEKSLVDHFTHLFVHATLHLLGHDHMKKSEQKKMEELEVKILKKLGIENPY